MLLRKKSLLMRFQLRSLNNEILKYKPGSPEKEELDRAISAIIKSDKGVPLVIGTKRIFSGDEQDQKMPHNHQCTIVNYCYSNAQHIGKAIKQALVWKPKWVRTTPEERAEIWHKCAEIIAKEDRHMINAAIIIGQGKPIKQAEQDTFTLINVLQQSADRLLELHKKKLKKNNFRYFLRPLPGFVGAIGPFNETNLSAQLALGPALMGNCVLWKPANTSVLSNFMICAAMTKAGLPPGVINFMPSNSSLFVNEITKSPFLSGINYVGRTENFVEINNVLALRMQFSQNIPRFIGECGTNNFHFVHECADVDKVVKATIKAAFEYSGQKCTACSRIYVPESLWCELNEALSNRISCIKVGDPCDFKSFMSAVINERSYERIVNYIKLANGKSNAKILWGGEACKTLGYFIEPTMILCEDPTHRLMLEEINGPVLSVFVYKNAEMDKILDVIANSSKYAFTGSIFTENAEVTKHIIQKLRFAASNLYINSSCTGSVRGPNQFSGTGLSGTMDNKSDAHSLMCWASPQLIQRPNQREEKCDCLPTNPKQNCENIQLKGR